MMLALVIATSILWLAQSTPLVSLAGAPVKTTSGVLTGTAGKSYGSVSAYLGVPFAQPPIGPLRFAAPVAYKSSAPHNATAYGKDCPGTIALGGSGPGKSGVTDDCLFLNVWAPTPKAGDTGKKAVMVWFYGGGFVGGGTSGGMYDGTSFAKNHDVIVVTTNYRLTIFGFPGAPGLKDQNAGLLDQRLAVEWVRDNIEAFGGDPKKIVLVSLSDGTRKYVILTNIVWRVRRSRFCGSIFLCLATRSHCVGLDFRIRCIHNVRTCWQTVLRQLEKGCCFLGMLWRCCKGARLHAF
jgi:Carboxylesterase family